jgi:nitrile hydratase accessory protein
LSAPEVANGDEWDTGSRVFAEPWQAQAFAMAVELCAAGAFTWSEWAAALSRELAGDPADDGSRYYHHWVAALEGLAAERGLAGVAELERRKSAWTAAYLATPHGHSVELVAGREGALGEGSV